MSACLSDRHQGAYTLKQTNYHANAEYRRGQDVISETASLRLSLEQQIKIHRTRRLGHVLRMPSNRLPHIALYAIPKPEWRRTRGGQPMTREMKTTTAKLGSVGSVRLPGWGPRDAPNTWLDTLRDMAMNRTQWHTCCNALALNSC